MYVSHVAMFTTQQREMQTTTLHQTPHLRSCQKIGAALSVVWARTYLLRSNL